MNKFLSDGTEELKEAILRNKVNCRQLSREQLEVYNSAAVYRGISSSISNAIKQQ